MSNILASIDASAYVNSICDHAAWFARRLSGSVQLLHVIDRGEITSTRIDLSGSIGLGAKSILLEELTRADEVRSRLAQEHGRALLEGAKSRLLESGVIDVGLLHRHGEVAETVIEFEPSADLVVIGKRGESGNYSPGHLGSKVERVIRGSVRPVLIVPRVYMPITRTVVAFDGGSSALKALEHVASPRFDGVECHVVIVCDNVAEADRRVDVAQRALQNRPAPKIVVRHGEVEKQLIEYLRQGMGDLLVMGAYGHSRIRELIIGSTTTVMIRTAKVPVLLFR